MKYNHTRKASMSNSTRTAKTEYMCKYTANPPDILFVILIDLSGRCKTISLRKEAKIGWKLR
jgi:hypothetical protein